MFANGECDLWQLTWVCFYIKTPIVEPIKVHTSVRLNNEVARRGTRSLVSTKHVFERPRPELPRNWDGIESKHTVTCMVLKATSNDRRTTSSLQR
ncbi:hypothetical protein TNCV_4713651 [Trichonephila clavipes]|nr:hypothetical protein TNCV_4713651 [Trichonephila clavipes]